MTFEEIERIVNDISYKPGWNIISGIDNDRYYLQVSVGIESDLSIDSTDKNKRIPWKGGKRYLSKFMCRQEIVGIVFSMIKDAELHEVHEWFRYKSASIYNPHLDPDLLVTLAKRKSSFNIRENAMTMDETNV